MREYTIYNIKELLFEKEIEIIDSFILDAEYNQVDDSNIISFLCLNVHPSKLINLKRNVEGYKCEYLMLDKNLVLIRFYFN